MNRSVLVAVEQLRRHVPGGIGRYAVGLLDGLVGEGPAPGGVADGAPGHVTLHASRPPDRGADPLRRFGLPVVTSPLPGPLLTRAWSRGLATAPAGYGVVHAVSLAFPSVRGGQQLVVTVHDLAWRRHPEATTPRGRRWHEAALGRALETADALVVPSASVAEELRSAGASSGKVRRLPWGADHLPPPDGPGAAALLDRLGATGGYLLAASTLEPRKNLARLVAAYAAGRPSLPEPWPLVIVGPAGWGDSGLGRTVPEGVLAAGAVSDAVLAALYAGARAFAYVPLSEGFGFPPVEAMRAGVPVVTSIGVPSADPAEAPVATGSADPTDPALRVDPTSVDGMAEALVTASADEAVRQALVRRGAQWVAPMTWRRSAQAHLALWDGLR